MSKVNRYRSAYRPGRALLMAPWATTRIPLAGSYGPLAETGSDKHQSRGLLMLVSGIRPRRMAQRLFVLLGRDGPGFGAFLGNVEVTRKSVRAVKEWIRPIGILTALFHHGQSIAVDAGVAAQQGDSFCLLCDLNRTVNCGERLMFWGKSAARHERDDRLAFLFHRYQDRERSRRMAGRDHHCDRRVAEGEFLPISNDHVARRQRCAGPLRLRHDEIPVLSGHQDVRAVGLLKVRRPAEVVEVAVTDDDVFDLLRIESGLLHSGDQNLFGVFRRIQGVDDNDALTRCERPGTDVVEADVIKIVEDLRRLERLPRDRRQTCVLPQHRWP